MKHSQQIVSRIQELLDVETPPVNGGVLTWNSSESKYKHSLLSDYLLKSDNLAGLSNKATSRSNLDVLSSSQVNTLVNNLSSSLGSMAYESTGNYYTGSSVDGLLNSLSTYATNRSNHTGTQSTDTLINGITSKVFTTLERDKLAGITPGATANEDDDFLLDRSNHTGTQSADTLIDGTTNKVFLATERTKLNGIEVGASANSSDSYLLDRINHTGTQTLSTISNAGSIASQNSNNVNITGGSLVSLDQISIGTNLTSEKLHIVDAMRVGNSANTTYSRVHEGGIQLFQNSLLRAGLEYRSGTNTAEFIGYSIGFGFYTSGVKYVGNTPNNQLSHHSAELSVYNIENSRSSFAVKTANSSGANLLELKADGTLNNSASILTSDGTVSLPSFAFISDTNTGLYRVSADYLALVTGGTARIHVDNSGNIGIGTTPTGSRLIVSGISHFLSNIYAPTLTAQADNTALGLQHRSFTAANTAINALNGTISHTSGTFNGLSLTPTYNSAANSNDIFVNRTESGTLTGNHYFLRLQQSGVDRFTVLNNGNATCRDITASNAVIGSFFFSGNISNTGHNGTIRLNYDRHQTTNTTLMTIGDAGNSTSGFSSQTSGTNVVLRINRRYKQLSGNATNIDFVINRIEDAIGSGDQFFMKGQISGVDKFTVNTNGVIMVGNLSSAPGGTLGQIYYNTSDNHFYGYNGSWKQLDN
jgi:hypothetical protein